MKYFLNSLINTKATTRNKLEPLLTVADTGIFNYESIAKEGSSDEVLAQLAPNIRAKHYKPNNDILTDVRSSTLFLLTEGNVRR